MSAEELFIASSEGFAPKVDTRRQAVDSLRGYAYQITAAALAWLDIEENGRIYLEVAEDYAIVADDALKAVQVKDTRASASATLNAPDVREAIKNFVVLANKNPNIGVRFEYFTTSEIGKEKPSMNFPSDEPGLRYWRTAAKAAGDVIPLRRVLESEVFPTEVRDFVKSCDDEQLRYGLLSRICWNCGQSDWISLRKNFIARLAGVVRNRLSVLDEDIARIADVLLYHVLEKSVYKTPEERTLTKDDLISIIDRNSRTSIPNSILSSLLEAAFPGSRALASRGVVSSTEWLVDGGMLQKEKQFILRPHVEAIIEEKLREFGSCFIYGTSGVGKTHEALSVAKKLGRHFVVVDFRNTDTDEAKGRIQTFLSCLDDQRAQIVILEDLNCFSNTQTEKVIAQIFNALRRRDISIIVTCYEPPTSRALLNVELGPNCTQECPYFSVDETKQLVSLYGGDPGVWGGLAHISGDSGHPQLVHAFVAGMSARGWRQQEISQRLSSGDIDAERDAARKEVVKILPEQARNLLYRLSLVFGNFNRAVALQIAEVSPLINSPGESLDILTGPWIEKLDQDSYRVSPLAAKFWHEMISPPLQTEIHSQIVTHILSTRKLHVSDISRIIQHAFLGKRADALAIIAINLVNASEPVIHQLVDNVSRFRAFQTDKPIYPDNLAASVFLRLVQFKTLVATKDRKRIPLCVNALRREVESQQHYEIGELFRISCLGLVLNTIGIANYLEDWFELLQEFRATTRKNLASDKLLAGIPAIYDDNTSASFFAVGSAGLENVVTLERIFDKLNEIEPDERLLYLRTISEMFPDYAELVNNPWVVEQSNALDYNDAAERYRRMAIKTAQWGIRPITLQCWIAQAILFDEYANDHKRALQVLDDAVAACGDDVMLSHARAKIYAHSRNHKGALSIWHEIANDVGQSNCLEKTFALRLAAISAAKTEDWIKAEEWFLESRESALKAKSDDMKVMATGLVADAAVAALQARHIEKSLRLIGNALTELESIDPKLSLRSMYCHHCVRYTLLWLSSRIINASIKDDGNLIAMEPGCCSNLEPPATITEHPLKALDIAWYTLAELDVVARTDIGYANKVQQRFAEAPILQLEFGLRTKQLFRTCESLNHEEFAARAWDYVESGVSVIRSGKKDFDVFNPPREPIPALSLVPLEENTKGLIENAMLSFAIACACKHSADSISLMRSAMAKKFGKEVVDATFLSLLDSETKLASASSFNECLIQDLQEFRTGVHLAPRHYFVTGVHSLLYALRSDMRCELISIISVWQREAWIRIIASETFHLAQPRLTVPTIEVVLSNMKNDERFLCALFLAASDAIRITLPHQVRVDFQSRIKGS